MLLCREKHANAVNENGLIITGLSDFTARLKAVTELGNVEKPDLIIFTVKAYDTESLAAKIEDAGTFDDCAMLALQNGLGNEEIISERLPGAKVIAGSTSLGAILRRPGCIEHTGISDTFIGPYSEGTDGLSSMVTETLTGCGIDAVFTQNIIQEKWYKAIINACINPITALLQVENGGFLKNPVLMALCRDICREGVDAANAQDCGLDLDYQTAILKTKRVMKMTRHNRSSMLFDVANGKRTEIDFINLAISHMGRKKGVDCPVNESLGNLIKRLEPEQ
jgi:2-dehydropantoate 2-reductase